MFSKQLNLTNKKFGRLTVIKMHSKINYSYYWLCKCDCGKEKHILQGSLISGKSKSCGCLRSELISSKKRELSGTRFYKIWSGMKCRCNNKNKSDYRYYGGRGISVCAKWNSFEMFKIDMYSYYLDHCKEHGEKNTTLDRVDNNKNYSPENCKWATMKVQCNNRNKKKYAKKIL